MPMTYLDNATSTRPDPRILPAMLPFLGEEFGSSSSPHSAGQRAREALERAREQVARLLECRAEEVVFTGSATEANNLAVKGAFRSRGRRSRRVLVSAIEHVSVLHPAAALTAEGAEVLEIGVDPLGRVNLGDLSEALQAGAALVSVMHGNPEVGTLQPVREVARLARQHGALVHTDATLTAGLFPGLWRDLEVDLLTLAPHLFHGPKGIGALLVREGTRLRPQIEGGIQEGGLRAGTIGTALAVGFGEASRLAREEAPGRCVRLRDLASNLRGLLESDLEDWVPTGDPSERVPGHLSLCLRWVEGEAVLGLLDDAGIQAGSGSACTLGAGKPSHVLRAIGVDPILSRGAVDFCFGIFSTAEDVKLVGQALPDVVAALRRLSPLTPETGASEG